MANEVTRPNAADKAAADKAAADKADHGAADKAATDLASVEAENDLAARVADGQAEQAKLDEETRKAQEKETLEQAKADLEAREKALAEREAALKRAPEGAPTLPGGMPYFPGQNFNLQNAIQQDANMQARQIRTNEAPEGTRFLVPVFNPLTGAPEGWKAVNGNGEKVD